MSTQTTTINLLTGMFRPDYHTTSSSSSNSSSEFDELHDSFVYGNSISSEMDQVRRSLGVCPQHDVLFEALNVEEHILFFAQLKGASYEAAANEASTLLNLFHLAQRMDHLGNELSGGQRRKLSVAIAVCGGSKFVVLDEPTAGMDPLARRELWDLLAGLRKGRTMLLTTHYMDEADVLGDRVGIMSLGEMQCLGSTQFLKTSYGAGYKLIFDKVDGITATHISGLTSFIQSFIPEAVSIEEEGNTSQVLFSLPFSAVSKFGSLFTRIEEGGGRGLDEFFVSSYGITIASLEEVFLKVGEDHTVTPQHDRSNDDGSSGSGASYGIGADRVYQSDLASQTLGIFKRKLMIAYNDQAVTIPLIGIPIATVICAAILYDKKVISNYQIVNELVVTAMYLGGYIGAPGLIAEFIVKERSDRLRNVLTVMGCDFRAYWLGTFLADFALLCLPMVLTWISWPIANMEGFYSGLDGMAFFITILFAIQIITFSYFWSFIFTSPKSCVSFMPILIILLLICPNIVLIIIALIAQAFNSNVADSVWSKILMTMHACIIIYLGWIYTDIPPPPPLPHACMIALL
jgi:ATP-binding cassette, subfamily A (ABC1), member 3